MCIGNTQEGEMIEEWNGKKFASWWTVVVNLLSKNVFKNGRTGSVFKKKI